MNLLSYEEIKEIFDNVNVYLKDKNITKNSLNIIEKLTEKIMKNESIIELKEELKEIQKFFILGIVESEDDLNRKEYLDIYQISNSFRDFSFCSKWYISYRVSDFIIKNYNCFEDLVTCLVQDEMTNSLTKNNPKKNDNLLDSVFGDLHNKEETSKELSKEIIIQINNLLSKQNYIIIEEKNFNEKIKSIEKDLKIETIEYLQINDIPNKKKKKNKNDHKKNKIRTFFLLFNNNI